MLFPWRRDPALCGLAKPAFPVSGDQIIDRIARSHGNQSEDSKQGEREPEQTQHSQNRVRAKPDPLVFDHDDGARPFRRYPAPHGKARAGFGLTGTEAKNVFFVEPQEEVDPAVAEATLSIKNHYRVLRHRVS